MRATKTTKRLGFLGALATSAALLLAGAAPASAAPAWRIEAMTNPTALPGEQVGIAIEYWNAGDASLPAAPAGDSSNCTVGAPEPPAVPGNCYRIIARFPPEITPISTQDPLGALPCAIDGGANTVTCEIPAETSDGVLAPHEGSGMVITVEVSAGAVVGRTLKTTFEVSGGGAGSETTAQALSVTSEPPPFDIAKFDGEVTADAAGNPMTQAAGRPYAASTSIEFTSITDPVLQALLDFGALTPVEPPKTVVADLPPGFIGNPTVVDQCTLSELANTTAVGGLDPASLCPATSQVGVAAIRASNGAASLFGPVPVYSMVPPHDVPASFGFALLGTVVLLDAEVRSESDYGVSVVAQNIPQGLALQGSSLTFWGVPSDASHDLERACPGVLPPSSLGPTCSSGAPSRAFLRNPTFCTNDVGLETTLRTDSWVDPGDFKTGSFVSHLPPGYPLAPEDWGDEQGTTDCDRVPFKPSIRLQPTTQAADSPTGLTVDLSLPQSDDPDVPGTSDLRDAVVTLPKGMSVNPSSADGLGACTSDQIGLDSRAPANCPDSSKIGEVEIETPLLREPLDGSIYLAKQGDNKFGSLLAIYLVAEGQGVVVKLPGKVSPQADGRLISSFTEQPQVPFSNLHLEFYGGPRAALRTPAACGTYTSQSVFTPWSGNADVTVSDSFRITSGPGGGPCANPFNPKLSGGVVSPLGGAHSPFSLRITREDGTQELSGVDVRVPQGLTAVLRGVARCPQSAIDAVKGMGNPGQGALELGAPACPAASQVGNVVVGAGAGTNPFYVQTAKAYLGGPYKGAPLSFAFVTPAMAGPFDLGNVVVQAAAHVDPVTAQVTVRSDPLPSILHGIPLDIRDVRVNLDRPNFMLNPTSCDAMSVDSLLTSTQGATANPSDRFQVSDCSSLGFKPKLTLSLRGKTNRGAHPALTAILRPRPGDANLTKISVGLPKSEFLDQAHIRTVCTRAQFASSTCPRGAIYGEATVTTPLFDQTLSGPVYLRSSNNLLPDLVPDLRGPAELPIRIESAGRIDEVNGGIRNTFDVIPDAPFTKLVLRLKGGNKGLLQNSRNICKQAFRATVKMDGQNGKTHDFKPVMKADCGKKSKKKGKRGAGRR